MFFNSELSERAMNSFIQKGNRSEIDDSARKTRLHRSLQIVSSIKNNPIEWSNKCSFNIEHIGDLFINMLSEYSTDSIDNIDSIYTCSYRFLCEYDFFIGPGLELSFDLRDLRSKIQTDALKLDSEVSSQIIYASYIMPANLLKHYINNEDIANVATFKSKVEEANRLKEEWNSELKQKQDIVENLSKKLDGFETAFNFVGLYDGFEKLSKNKENFYFAH